jgi:hypothetical protein
MDKRPQISPKKFSQAHPNRKKKKKERTNKDKLKEVNNEG